MLQDWLLELCSLLINKHVFRATLRRILEDSVCIEMNRKKTFHAIYDLTRALHTRSRFSKRCWKTAPKKTKFVHVREHATNRVNEYFVDFPALLHAWPSRLTLNHQIALNSPQSFINNPISHWNTCLWCFFLSIWNEKNARSKFTTKKSEKIPFFLLFISMMDIQVVWAYITVQKNWTYYA